MKREYKVYKKGGYTYVHYDGFPEGVKIEKTEDFYDYPWGWMTIDRERGFYDIHDEDHKCLFNLLWNGTIVTHEGMYGVVDSQGEEVMPCVFDQIEKLKDSVFGRKGDSYWEFRECGSSTLRGNYSDTGFYVENGKKGWKEDGKVVVPAQYDDICHYRNSNFYQVLNDEKWAYINRYGEPVLTHVRVIESADATVPLPFKTNNNNVLVFQEYVGEEKENDKNVVLLNGVWQRLDRISGNEICKMLVNPDDEKPLSDKDLELFNNKFSYEFAAYQVTSQEQSGIIDCLKKLQSMGLHCNSWHYIVKIWKPVGENPSAEELRFLRYQIEKHHQLGDLRFCLAHDANLKAGETRMFVVTHYNERCWPAHWEFEWWKERQELTLSQIKRRLTKLHKTINTEVLEPYREEVWQDQIYGCIYSMGYNKNRTWKETVKVLDYFKKKGSPIINGIRNEAKEISATLHYKTQFSRAKCQFHIRKLRWLIENGADINAHYDNYTGLDYLVGNYKYILEDDFSAKDKEYIDKMRALFINILLEHDAKTLQQVKEEESKNNDYKVELQRMN
jgi:hypothetical protein